MAISSSSVLARKQTPGSNPGKSNASRFKYPVLRAGQNVFQLLRVEDFKDEKFGKEEYDFMKLRFVFVLLIKGADKAESKEEQDLFRSKGHGKYFSLEMNPICSPPGRNRKTGESTKPSNLYELLRVLVNDGDPLTPEQLGQDEQTKRMKPEQRAQVAAERLAQMLGDLEKNKVQVYGMLVQKVNGNGKGEKYNKLASVVGVLAPEDYLPEYKPFARPADPREEDDDQSIVCSVTGERIRGWENRDGEWVSNEEWAKMQAETFGDWLYQGKYPAPFGPQTYRAAKEAFYAENGDEETPF